MSKLTVHIYTSKDQLPDRLMDGNFFHSERLFQVVRQTPRQQPLLVTVEDEECSVVAQMLAIVLYRSSWLPPYFYASCRIYGEGIYAEAKDSSERNFTDAKEKGSTSQNSQAELFDMMIATLRKHVDKRVLFVEVSDLSQKMFGYRSLRQNGFFPVKWMSIHNSLHSRTPEERISNRKRERIEGAMRRGVTVCKVETDDDFRSFMRLLRHHNWLKPQRYVPDERFFSEFRNSSEGELAVTRYNGHIIGCSATVYSQGQAFLWYTAFRRKTFLTLHPADVTVWMAIKRAQEKACEHIYFMNVGLPFRRNRYRNFILSFGGKPVSTFRWFRCSIGWLNRILAWIYRD